LDFNQVVGRFRDGSPVRLASFNYFLLLGLMARTNKSGPGAQVDPIFLARLAYEGFFTITTGRGRDRKPLPELQPYYGVLDWKNFSLSKPVKKALKRAKTRSEDVPSVGVRYYLYCNRNFQLTYQGINEYHKDPGDMMCAVDQHGENWMTWKYLEAFKRELYDGPLPENGDAAPKLVAGEIGYSIGKIYTSLSGFNLRGEDGVGWIQLSCLGKWLEQKNYSFWSLGHCYSPQMEYKRQLGHRIYTREEFLQRLKLERGRALQLEGGTAWNFEGTFDEALGTDRRLAEIKPEKRKFYSLGFLTHTNAQSQRCRCVGPHIFLPHGGVDLDLEWISAEVPGGMGKLKSGHGDAVCQALRRVSFEFHAPTYPDEGMADEADVDSDAEIHSVGEDEMPGDGEEDDLMYQEDAPKPPEDDENDHQVLQANVDPKEWLLEVERVSSRLKVQMPNDSKEWRTHLQQTKQYKQVIENQFPASKVQLDKLVAQLSQAMDRIKSKEAFINTQFDHRAVDYRQQQEELTQAAPSRHEGLCPMAGSAERALCTSKQWCIFCYIYIYPIYRLYM
ncbi:Intraflagellar transport protein 57 homolog, partial [Durusdinium trenchii]